MSAGFIESVIEDAALGWLEVLGYAIDYGAEIAVADRERLNPAQCGWRVCDAVRRTGTLLK
jgi:hypothetical protein